MAISDSTPLSVVPANATDMKSKITWIMTGSEIKKNGITIKENYAPSLERLEVSIIFLEFSYSHTINFFEKQFDHVFSF